MSKKVLGIDIGGSGIKGAPVDVDTGQLLAERFRIATPQPATPRAVAETVRQLAEHFSWSGPVGCTFPAVVQHGVTLSAANVDKSWIGTHAEKLLEEVTGLDVTVINDADAAALGEVAFGAGKGRMGMVLLLTFGTGIGSGLIVDGKLVPNTELGHLQLEGNEVEKWCSAKVKEDQELSFRRWAKRVNKYLAHLEMLFTPDMFILGGGISKDFSKFGDLLEVKAELLPAELRNNAGIVGAALAAQAVLDGRIDTIGSDLTPATTRPAHTPASASQAHPDAARLERKPKAPKSTSPVQPRASRTATGSKPAATEATSKPAPRRKASKPTETGGQG